MNDAAATAEFLDSLSFNHRIIYRRRKTSNALRAWIVFYERILINDNVRIAVQNNGYKSWELDYPTSAYKFRLPWNQYGSEGIPIEFAKTLWKKLLPMWVHHTLHSPSFEVFRTLNMGLGLRSKIHSSLAAMACKVHGFLEFISEEEEAKTGVFCVLTESKHSSLFWGSNADLLLQNAILYGPLLSLCNSNEFTRDIRNPHKIQFFNFHYNGVDGNDMQCSQKC